MTTPEPDRSTPQPGPASFAAFAGLGLTIAVTVGVFVALGIWGDSVFETSPLCLVIGLVLGCAAATASTVALVRRYL